MPRGCYWMACSGNTWRTERSSAPSGEMTTDASGVRRYPSRESLAASVLLTVGLVYGGCQLGREDSGPSIKQGVRGSVLFYSGDFMPIAPRGVVEGVSRTIEFHAPTSPSDVVSAEAHSRWGPFFSEVRTPMLAEVTSDSGGYYEVALPVGRYSVFVVEGDRWYANGDDGRHIQPVTVYADSVVQFDIKITHEATF